VKLFFLLILTAVSAFSLEFSLRPGGFVFFPIKSYKPGAGVCYHPGYEEHTAKDSGGTVRRGAGF
jgi:hypothetical protein